VPEQFPSDPDGERSPFDDFVNNHLDFEGFDDEDEFERPPSSGNSERPSFYTLSLLRMNREQAVDEDEPESSPPEPRMPRPIFGLRGALPPFPSLDDSRWRRGTFEVVKDLRVHKTPTFAPSPFGSSSNVMVFANAYRYANKRLRYIPDIFPGWSAVQLLWEKPVIGYVNHNEVRLMPSAPKLKEYWTEILLIVGVCLLLLVIGSIALVENERARARIESLQAEIAALNARIEALEDQLIVSP
jgi:hypothetical protein